MRVNTWSPHSVASVPGECRACRTHLRDTSCLRNSRTDATFCWLHSCSSQQQPPLVLQSTDSSNGASVARRTLASVEAVTDRTTAEMKRSFLGAVLPWCHSTALVACRHGHGVVARRHQTTDSAERHLRGVRSVFDLAQMSSSSVTRTGRTVPCSVLKYYINCFLLQHIFFHWK